MGEKKREYNRGGLVTGEREGGGGEGTSAPPSSINSKQENKQENVVYF